MRYALLWLIVAATELNAQDTTSRASALCVHAHATRCRHNLILEVAAMGPLVSTQTTRGSETRRDFGGELAWAIGAARTLSGRRSVGVAVIIEAERDLFGGVQARYRRWVSERSALEVSAGYATDVLAMRRVGHGIHAGVALLPTRTLSLNAAARVMQTPDGAAASVMLGASLNGASAVVASVIWGKLARGMRGW